MGYFESDTAADPVSHGKAGWLVVLEVVILAGCDPGVPMSLVLLELRALNPTVASTGPDRLV